MTDFFKFAQQAIQSAAETAAKAGENIGNAASVAGQAVAGTAAGVGGAIGDATSVAGQAIVGTAVGVGGAIGDAASVAGQTVVGTAVGVGGAIGDAASVAGQTVVGTAVGVGGAIGDAASAAGEIVVGTAVGVGGAIGDAASVAGQTVVGTAVGVGGAIGDATSAAGQAIVGTAVGVGGAIGDAASVAGQAIVGTAVGVGGAIGNAASVATEGVGYAISLFGDNPQVREIIKALQVDWLVQIIAQINISDAETEVRKLIQQYPNEQASEIAHRLILNKALFAGGMGLTSSLVPGAAVVLLPADLLALFTLQGEMLYQIACAYGLDLGDPARKGEALAIFGLLLGGSHAFQAGATAMKAGLVFLESIPFAGAAIGASTNAAMTYALGYAACRFYEAKINPSTSQYLLT